ncbi:hypothetical protein BJY24_005682 [Nocardia transvalensis]|uniref:Uncharacterized protein n=1 Tax=Nocardia transvalensis TaxID=37333 RepID=A0A7W9ULJ5_9NOCA|nr:hypothetical protein [Nocardia transvalensis]MBB5916770.1 hypothetical protein [Nocardia transvalensis]
MRDYITAWHAIIVVEQHRDAEIAALRQQIDTATARAATDIAAQQHTQARSAATIRDEGHNESQIAQLLEITPKQARKLLTAAPKTTPIGADTNRPRRPARRIPAQRRTSPGDSATRADTSQHAVRETLNPEPGRDT